MSLPNSRSVVDAFSRHPAIAEKFHILSSNLLAMREDSPIQSIIVTGSVRREGTSTVSAMLAIALSNINQKVLLIDANFHHPIQHHLFGVGNERGFQEYLSTYSALQDFLMPTEVPGLSLMTSGPIRENSKNRYRFSEISAFIREMVDPFDFVIIDTPPVNAYSDVQNMLRYADGCLLTVRSDHTSAHEVREASKRIRSVKGALIGIILNDHK